MKNLEHVLPGLTMQSRAANGGFWKNCYFGALVVEEVLKNADHLFLSFQIQSGDPPAIVGQGLQGARGNERFPDKTPTQ